MLPFSLSPEMPPWCVWFFLSGGHHQTWIFAQRGDERTDRTRGAFNLSLTSKNYKESFNVRLHLWAFFPRISGGKLGLDSLLVAAGRVELISSFLESRENSLDYVCWVRIDLLLAGWSDFFRAICCVSGPIPREQEKCSSDT